MLAQLADRLGTVFDVGANCGFFTARLLTCPAFKGRVHAFELVPATYQALTRMRDDCQLAERVTCHPFGLSDRDGTVGVAIGMHSALARVADGGALTAEVKALDGQDLPDPDLIKIDVEGHEARVLAGARHVLERARPFVVFESWHLPEDPAAMRAPFDRLAEAGYRFFALSAGWTADRQIHLRLLPITPDSRREIPDQLNVLAVHDDRLPVLAERFPEQPD